MSKNQAKMCLMIRDMCIVPPLSLSLSLTQINSGEVLILGPIGNAPLESFQLLTG